MRFVRPFSTRAKRKNTTAYGVLGRPSNNLKVGIVGMPNIGKSTLFNALTNNNVPAENYPFCTIDPSEARVIVPDERVEKLAELYRPKSLVPAYLSVIDIAGLVRGAASGAGLGNAFLSNVQSVDGIYHLVRAFEDDNIEHVEAKVDPIRDMEIIHDELRLKDESFLEKLLTGGKKRSKADADGIAAMRTAEKAANFLAKGSDIRSHLWTVEEAQVLNRWHLLTAKPVVYLCNVNEEEYKHKNNQWIPDIKKWISEHYPEGIMIPFSGPLEAKIMYGESDTSSAIPEIVSAGYRALNLIRFFTAGPEEVRAWTIRSGTHAPQAAGVIHTDLEKGFIMAEVMKYPSVIKMGAAAVKAVGKQHQQGRDYVMQDGDVVYFKTRT